MKIAALPRNEAEFLLGLGPMKRPAVPLLPCPAYHVDRQTEVRVRAWSEASSTGQLETPSEVNANLRAWRSPAERARPSRSAPGKATV